MKHSLPYSLALVVLATGLSTAAFAQNTTTPVPYPQANKHLCSSEHQNVVAACKSDPCSTTCKSAHQAMKQCREANNLPVKQHVPGLHKGSPCKTSTIAPAPSPTPAPAAPNTMPSGQ